MAQQKAVYHLKYQWRPDWIDGDDTIIASSSEEARQKAEERLLKMKIDGDQVNEVQITGVTRGTNVSL